MMSTALVTPRRSNRDRPSFDATWVLAAKAGYVMAFKELIARNERRVYRLAFNATQDREDAEDVLQSTFIKAYDNLHELRDVSRFSSWVLRIATCEALQRLREKCSKEVALDQPPETDATLLPRDLQDWCDDPTKGYTARELERILSAGIGALKPISRIVFLLCDVDKCPVREVADMLGLSVPAVKSRLLRARLEMREYLNPYFKRKNDSVPGRTTPLMGKQKESHNERTISSPTA